MGKKYTTRHAARRKLLHSIHLCDKINMHFADISGAYSENPMHILDALVEIGRIVEAARNLMVNLRDNM